MRFLSFPNPAAAAARSAAAWDAVRPPGERDADDVTSALWEVVTQEGGGARLAIPAATEGLLTPAEQAALEGG